MRRALLGLALIAGCGAAALSSAAFGDQTANPTNTFTAAASFCPTSSQVTVTPNRDTYVDLNSPSNNFGTAGSLRVTSRHDRDQRTLIGFTLPAAPAGCSLTAATLTLSATSSTTNRTLQAFQISPAATWTETGVTWNNQPATTGAAATTTSGSAPSFTVTTQVQAMYAGANPNNGFLVRDQTEDAGGSGVTQIYRDRTSASGKPQLVLTFG